MTLICRHYFQALQQKLIQA
jgi:hypothetical protein